MNISIQSDQSKDEYFLSSTYSRLIKEMVEEVEKETIILPFPPDLIKIYVQFYDMKLVSQNSEFDTENLLQLALYLDDPYFSEYLIRINISLFNDQCMEQVRNHNISHLFLTEISNYLYSSDWNNTSIVLYFRSINSPDLKKYLDRFSTPTNIKQLRIYLLWMEKIQTLNLPELTISYFVLSSISQIKGWESFTSNMVSTPLFIFIYEKIKAITK